MSTKYTGGFITKSPVAPTSSAASGIWTLDQQQQAQKAGTWPSPPIFIEDLFSTYLYTGTGAAQTITNGIDLSGQGGLVWEKGRSSAQFNGLVDTVRGVASCLVSSSTGGENTVAATGISAFNSNGFTQNTNGDFNTNGETYVSWTFRKQSKFFDIVTWTGDGTAPRTINHNLGSTPGCIIVKRVSGGFGEDWHVFHRSLTAGQNLVLNSTAASASGSIGSPTSTTFTISSASSGNSSGYPYVAYLFAHDAGGFPVSGGGSTNGISCGTFTTDGSGKFTVNLGYEPQWIMIKLTNFTSNWSIFDNMRGMPVGSPTTRLIPNLSDAESSAFSFVDINATGFASGTGSGNPYSPGQTWIYVAIRRGPMKTPTVGTSVYTPITYNGNGTSQTITGSVGVPDLGLGIGRTGGAAGSNAWYDRLRGKELALRSTLTNAEYNASPGGEGTMTNVMNGMRVENTYGILNDASTAYVLYFMSRAPGFFDEVCYTGTEVSGQTFTHNLGVVPEMMIVKSRSGTTDWTVYHSALGASARIYLNLTNAANTGTAAPWNSTTPTSSVFSLGNAGATNLSGGTFVNYLFATVAGVSKVGSYTGTGALLTVNCGFTSGARFVLIKRTDSTGDWFTYDSARGITSGNDPYLLLNSSAAEVTGTNYVDTDTTGFKVTAAAPAGLNANGGTYIFLAIA